MPSTRSGPSTARSPSASARSRTPTSTSAVRSAPTGCCGRSATGRICGRLRARLNLDSGYLSRLIASLQREGLVETAPGRRQARARGARSPTAAAPSSRSSTARATSSHAILLAPLGDKQRATLLEAMATVERLLTAGLVEITVEDPRSAGRPLLPDASTTRSSPSASRRLRRLDGASRPTIHRSSSPACGASRSAAARSGSATATSSACGSPPRRAGLASAGGSCASSRASRRRRSRGWRPTAPCRRRSTSTARWATSRSSRSTTSPTPTTGSRSGSRPR